MSYTVTIDYSNNFRFGTFREAAAFTELALTSSTKEKPSVKIELNAETEPEEEQE